MNKPIKPLEELLDSVRDIEGFPIGKDKDILALSDPPYYTACPNPYINDFIEEYGTPYDEKTDSYHCDPFIKDVSEGKNDPVYMAHTYHTKVPHKAIMHYIKHYTKPNDIVFDGFCGTGMTGVAAQLTNRHAVLSDLSPAASLISYCLNSKVLSSDFFDEAKKLIDSVEKDLSWTYKTKHKTTKELCDINYIIWSDILICPYCNAEYSFWDEAFDGESFYSEYRCPGCDANISKKDSKTAEVVYFDSLISREVKQKKQVPAFINYRYKGKTYFKVPDQYDREILDEIDKYQIPYQTCNRPMLFNDGKWGDMWRAGVHFGFTHSHHFYTKRNLIVLSHLFHAAFKSKHKQQMLLLLTSFTVKTGSKLHNIGFKNGKINLAGAQPNSLYIPSLFAERNIFILARGKAKDLSKMYASKQNSNSSKIFTQVGSATNMSLPNNSIDYIFVDPPFGDNLMYSELNFLWEDWLRVYTNSKEEAIISSFQNKNNYSYKELMKESFCVFYKILKPNRWITVEFHNSKSEVWNIIQDTLLKAGFIIAQVAILDKKQGTKNQMTTKGAVSKDLVISAYKPNQSFEDHFLANAGEGFEEEFIKMHLSHLKVEPTVERTEQMLYSKLIAYYVQRSYAVKYDAGTFYKMLRANFIEEDGYWFNKDQIESYREFKQKMRLEEIEDLKSGQMMMFIDCEKSAIIWLHTFLDTPKDFQTIHPAFTKIANMSNDRVPELTELLDKNFIFDNGKYRRPQTEDEKLSLTQKRERELQKEFDVLLLEAKGSKKKIKECRKQAVIYGFEQCYKNNRFQDILDLGKRLDKQIIENDSEISEFIDVAEIKVEGF